MKIKLIQCTFLLCLLLLVLPRAGQAQDIEVKGTVYENSKTNPLVGVNVILLNANNRIVLGTSTDINGNFKIRVPKEGIAKISFSFIGMISQTFPLEAGKTYEVILKEDNTTLTEVVVRGNRNTKADMGLFQKDRRELVSAVTSIDMKALETTGVSSVEQMLQGAAPGMLVTFNSGDPGAGASIKIRGTTSLSGNSNPLWIIDGAEVISDDYSVESITNFGYSPVGDIDPSDIESIDILKDASATAIYGSRGANGVIVIKTKRGVKGKPQFSASAKLNATFVPKRIPMLNGDQQRIFLIENYANNNNGDDGSFLKELRGDLTRKDAWMYNNNTDWVDEISRTGFQQDYTFSLRGGGERLNYYWGLGYTNEYGTTIGGGYDRFSTNVNLDYRISDKLKIATKFSYTHSLTDKRSSDHPLTTADDAKRTISPLGFARARAAYFPVYNENGTEYNIERADQEGTSWTSQYNPVAIIDYSSFKTLANRFTSAVQINYDLTRRIGLYSQVSVDYRQSGDDYFMPPYAIGAIAGEDNYNYGMKSDGYQMKLVNNNRIIVITVETEKHHLDMTAVVELIYNRSNSMSIAYSNGANPSLREADGSARINNISGSKGLSTSISLVLNAHYKFMDRYNLDVSLKTEGSSLYGKDNPYSLFPTVGLSYDMKKEGFLVDKEWVDLLKPRFAFGRSGKLPNVANILSVTYGAGSDGYLGDSYTYINKFAYDNVHEERTNDFNYGLDWNMFNSRFSGEFNYYTRKTTDLLLLQSVASSSGFSQQYTNFGTIKNQGWELGLNAVWIEKPNIRFRWKSYFNIAHNRNKLVELPENFEADNEAYTQTIEGFKSKLVPGDVIGGFYGFEALGVYANDADAIARDFNGNQIYNSDGTPKMLRYNSASGHEFRGGDVIYQDINHDGLINDLDMVQIGDANPDVFGMFRNEFNWKQWSLTVGLYYNFGQDVVNGMRRNTEGMTGQDNQARSVERRWRKQGDVTDIPRAERNATWNTVASTRWVEDASFIKLKELSLTYQFDKNICQKLRLNQLSIWANVQNLWTWTKYKGIDPEIGSGGGITIFGVDKQNTAPPIRLTFGLRASF